MFSDPQTSTRIVDQYTFDGCILQEGTRVDDTRVEGEATTRIDTESSLTGNSKSLLASLDGFVLVESDGEEAFRIEASSRSVDSVTTVTGECSGDGPDVSRSTDAVGRLPVGTGGTVLERLDSSYTGVYGNVDDDSFEQPVCALVETLSGRAELRLSDDRVLLAERRLDDVSLDADALDARLTLRVLPDGGSLSVSPVDGGPADAVRVEIDEDGTSTSFTTTLDGWLDR